MDLTAVVPAAGMIWISGVQDDASRCLVRPANTITEGYRIAPQTANLIEEAKVAIHLIDEFQSLEDNWDGYAGSAISNRACDNARSFIWIIAAARQGLRIPDVSPKSAGTISFEWESPHGEAYFEIGDDLYSGIIKTHGQNTLYFQGRFDEINQQIITLIHSIITPASLYSFPVTEIALHDPWNERVAA